MEKKLIHYKWSLYRLICKIFFSKMLMNMRLLRVANRRKYEQDYGSLVIINERYYILLGNYYALYYDNWFAKNILNADKLIHNYRNPLTTMQLMKLKSGAK